MRTRNLHRIIDERAVSDFSKMVVGDWQHLANVVTLPVGHPTWHAMSMVSNELHARTAVGMREIYEDIEEVRHAALDEVAKRSRGWELFDTVDIHAAMNMVWVNVWRNTLYLQGHLQWDGSLMKQDITP